jgi:esterase/lipase superfamily enzyme
MRKLVEQYRKGMRSIALLATAALLALGGCSSQPALHARPEPATTQSAPGGKNAASPRRDAPTGALPAPDTRAAQAGKKSEPGGQPPATTKPKPVQVKVFYATDRARGSGTNPNGVFGPQRGSLTLGSCELMFPGRSEAGGNGQQAPEKPLRPVVRKVLPAAKDELLAQMNATLARSPRRRVLVFVPGYNVSFAEAARSTGYLKQALGFEGTAIFFSWPSKGRSDGFGTDEREIEWAQPDLKEFLKILAADAKQRSIYLVGQGMGGRALAKAFVYLNSAQPELGKAFREVILVAPDMELETFRRDLAPSLAASNARITIYASSNDPGLRASAKFQDYPRVGDSGPQLTLFPGLETIDASRVNTSLSGPLLTAPGNSIIADLKHLIRDGDKPTQRPALQVVEVASGRYWRLKRH